MFLPIKRLNLVTEYQGTLHKHYATSNLPQSVITTWQKRKSVSQYRQHQRFRTFKRRVNGSQENTQNLWVLLGPA